MQKTTKTLFICRHCRLQTYGSTISPCPCFLLLDNLSISMLYRALESLGMALPNLLQKRGSGRSALTAHVLPSLYKMQASSGETKKWGRESSFSIDMFIICAWLLLLFAVLYPMSLFFYNQFLYVILEPSKIWEHRCRAFYRNEGAGDQLY